MAKGKPWFGKRWTKSLIGWLDTLIFNRDDKPGYVTMDSSFCINFTIGLIIGACTVVLSLCMNEETLMPVISYGTVGCSLLASGAFLYKNLGFFSSIWAKIGRCLFVVVLNLVACLGAFLIGMWTALLALVCLVMWGILSMWLNDSNKKVVRIED